MGVEHDAWLEGDLYRIVIFGRSEPFSNFGNV